MCRAFQPFAMQGIYFSFKTSFKIKITPFHLCLLQSHHILREQKPQFVPNLKIHFNLNVNDNDNENELSHTEITETTECFLQKP